MAYKRTDRVNALLRHELQQIIQQEMTDPRVGFATVTAVETSPDLRHARVFVSVMGTEEEGQASLRALEDARPFLRRQLASRTDLRFVPDLSFKRDASIAKATRIGELLREAHEKEAARPGPGSNALALPADGNATRSKSKRVGVATEALPLGGPSFENEASRPSVADEEHRAE